ncbi:MULTISPECIES: hypothetical protein [Brevibacterium]|uniref:Type I restriction enzyme, S subunit n=1 Tax=Brevibacterium antiquum CNRZ 918 TaxID=1255637 RepID=A0A2H1KWF2_9MICO|nr:MULTISPECIES: hypothetical protein [Brevibacterium]SMY04040.1 hypothetical protein BANT918_02956 [Brevibacterium antiquum CNRZ 918]HCG55519.1 hypothetical protein [Brevibacterium sp.]
MRLAPVRSAALYEGNRIDARYFTSTAVRIKVVLKNAAEVDLRAVGDYANVRAPARFKRAYAAPSEEYISYLRPYDVFEFLPPEADRLSIKRTEDLEEYRIQPGDLLQTCSGRNLGPLTIADDYLARFALSHDMIRVTIADEMDRYYTLAVLQSPTGQALLRGDLNGSVIDHITIGQVSNVEIPFISSVQNEVAKLMREAVETRGNARTKLRSVVERVNEKYPSEPVEPYRAGWTVKASEIGTRLDAAFHSQHIADVRKQLMDNGGGLLGDAANVIKPGGRPKLYYVGPEEGVPFLSGRQILQLDVVGAKNIATRSVDKNSGYGLEKGWITFQADGRAEESLGYPSVVLEDRADWFASGHVGRAAPKNENHTGWIWASMASDIVQHQIAALACGSVVDALYESDLEKVVIPPFDEVDAQMAQEAWNELSESVQKSTEAIKKVESALQRFGV